MLCEAENSLRGDRNKGLVDLLLHRCRAGIGDLRRDGILLFIQIIFDLRRLQIPGQDADQTFTEILRNHDRCIVCSGVDACDRLLSVHKGPAECIVLFEVLDDLVTNVQLSGHFIVRAPVAIRYRDPDALRIAVRVHICCNIEPCIQRWNQAHPQYDKDCNPI